MNTLDRLYAQQEKAFDGKEDILNSRAILIRTLLLATSIREYRNQFKKGAINQEQYEFVRDWVDKINLTPIYLKDLPAE